jgi:predicted deacylase
MGRKIMTKRSLNLVRTLFFLSIMTTTAIAERVINVGEVVAGPGQKKSGFILVPGGGDGPEIQIPVTIINGVKPGPVLALTAGVHGYEYPPILTLQRLRQKLDPSRISGAVVMVHVVNIPSFFKRSIYYNPHDWKNQNRVFPGKIDGSMTERIAYQVTHEVLDQCDYHLDLHCGDDEEDIQSIVRGCCNTMKHLSMMAGSPELIFEPVWVKKTTYIRSEHEGIFYPLAHQGRHVQQGELLGYLTDFFGNIIQKAIAPHDGIIMYIISTPPLSKGEPMVKIGGF